MTTALAEEARSGHHATKGLKRRDKGAVTAPQRRCGDASTALWRYPNGVRYEKSVAMPHGIYVIYGKTTLIK